jgi:hypothetical protein
VPPFGQCIPAWCQGRRAPDLSEPPILPRLALPACPKRVLGPQLLLVA